MADDAMPEVIYAWKMPVSLSPVLQAMGPRRLWNESRIISDSVRYRRADAKGNDALDLGKVRDLFVQVQQEQISVGKAMELFEAMAGQP